MSKNNGGPAFPSVGEGFDDPRYSAPQPQPERQPVSEPTEAQIEYEILCNDEWVAGASGEGAEAEILHYLTQYEQDGPCEVYAVTRRLVDRAAFAAKDDPT